MANMTKCREFHNLAKKIAYENITPEEILQRTKELERKYAKRQPGRLDLVYPADAENEEWREFWEDAA